MTGKRLLAKCRVLVEENEDFGKQLSEGNIHKLQCELSLQKVYAEEIKRSLDGEFMLAFY